MTGPEIRKRGELMKGERLNETGRMCIDVATELLVLALAPKCKGDRAKLATAANAQIRAAMASDKLQDQENMENLLAMQEKKKAASKKARKLTLIAGGG